MEITHDHSLSAKTCGLERSSLLTMADTRVESHDVRVAANPRFQKAHNLVDFKFARTKSEDCSGACIAIWKAIFNHEMTFTRIYLHTVWLERPFSIVIYYLLNILTYSFGWGSESVLNHRHHQVNVHWRCIQRPIVRIPVDRVRLVFE